MKRQGVRTRTLGTGWEERFLEAVRKARERDLIPHEAAEKLRRLAGAYFCTPCKQEHRTASTLGKRHLRLQTAVREQGAAPNGKRRAKRLPIERTEKATQASAPVRASLVPRDPRTAQRVVAAAKQATLDVGDAKAPPRKRWKR